jgi:hypothetical protein
MDMPYKDPEVQKAYKKKYNKAYKKQYYEAHKEEAAAYWKEFYQNNKERLIAKQAKQYEDKRGNYLFYAARARAKKFNLPFDIEKSDVVIPEFCPIFGTKLLSGDRDTSPSLDRIIPELGYVKGNIDIISMRANRLKNDMSIEDAERILAWMKSKQVSPPVIPLTAPQ